MHWRAPRGLVGEQAALERRNDDVQWLVLEYNILDLPHALASVSARRANPRALVKLSMRHQSTPFDTKKLTSTYPALSAGNCIFSVPVL